MKKLILLISFLLSTFWLEAQVQYAGCTGPIVGGFSYPVTLIPSGNMGARTTFTSGNLGNCSAGVCAFRIIWTGANWEIQLSTDGGSSYTFILYRNSTPSSPNPPDLTLGTWVDVSGVGCGALGQLTGDVQNSVGGSAPEIDITGNGNSITDGDLTPAIADGTDFGNIALSTSAPQTFTIDNSTGTAALAITSIVVSGAQATEFVVSGAPTSVAAGATANFTLTFTPSATGVRNATVTINNNDADEGTYDFAVRGNGLGNPEINITGNGTSIVDGDVTPSLTDETDFGPTIVGNSSPQVFVIDNSAGTSVLSITNIFVAGAQAADFVVTGVPASVAAGATANFTLTFTPSAVGLRNATVTINNNDANEGIYDFAVQGNGVTVPSVVVTEWISNPTVNDPAHEWVELFNHGTVPVDLENWRLRDADADNALISTASYILQPGEYVVLARNKASFEANWLQCSDTRVLQVAMILDNGNDEIILEDNNGILVWSIAYANDGTVGRATYYTENTYMPRVWGSQATPGISRIGNDPATGTLGYQSNNTTADPAIRTALNGDIASPFDGSPTSTSIERGNGLDFDGGNDFVAIPASSSLDVGAGNFTMESWVKHDQASAQGPILEFNDGSNTGFHLWYFPNGEVYVNPVHTGSITYNTSSLGAATQEWNHIAVVREGADLRIYINGISQPLSNPSNFTATTIFETSYDLYIGARVGGITSGLTNFWDGQVDEVRIWNSARTATEIRENMHLTLDGCATNLVAYYQMNEPAGTTILPDEANGNNGTLNGMNVNTAWVNSEVNVGNDVAGTSNSQTLAFPAMAGVNPINFTTANLSLDVIDNTNAEDYTVTYQAFIPNTIAGVVGTNVLQNPMWTVNKETSAIGPRMNFTFNYPTNTFTVLDGTKYRLYWRPMNGDGNWLLLKNYARTVTSNSITFSNIYETGQFMVVQASELDISDVRGQMYDFDGTSFIDNTANAINLPVGNAARTMEAWIKTTQTTIGNILSWGRRTNNNRNSIAVRSGSLGFIGQFNDFNGSITINDGEWHHVAITHDGTTMRLYIDGILDASSNRTLNTLDQNLRIGTISLPSIGENFIGSMDEVRIWDVARTQDQLRENMHLTLKGNESGLVSYFQFNKDDAIGTMNGIKDALGIANGTTVNMTTSNRIASEVAVAGGVSERITVNGTGLINFGIPKVAIDFSTAPNGEVVVSRLMTEKPHGWGSISGDVDNEYFVIWNYGSNQMPVVNAVTFNELSYFAPALAANDVDLYKRGSREFGATWGTVVAAAGSITTGTPSNATFTGAPLTTGFSQFAIAQNNPIQSLPIELVSFDAKRTNRQEVQLHWTTAIERNNKGFEVERLLQGETEFTKVAYVAGNGTTTKLSTYYQVDPNSFTGTSYYRLKQLDVDGSFEYSPTRAVEGMTLPTGEGMTVFPNPTQGALNFQILEPLAPQKVQITLIDAQGRVVAEQTTTISSERVVQLPHLLNNLPNNLYFLQVQTEDGTQQWSKKISLR
ncbi:MAG: choice-of-anchor D domain-containing protein [Aureispira sp.]